MKNGKRLPDPQELMKIAAKVERLGLQTWEEPKGYRLAGRLARDPDDVEYRCEAIVYGVKRGDPVVLEITKGLRGWLLLQNAMKLASHAMWEQLWNDAHPDRFGRAWDEEDVDLISVWRERARAMIKECHQEAILAITVEEYFIQLTEAGESREFAEDFAVWISAIHEGDTPST